VWIANGKRKKLRWKGEGGLGNVYNEREREREGGREREKERGA